jgi:hypothetical protein
MNFLIGLSLALGVGGFARWFGLDRDRAFYPTVMTVIAFYYVLFALMAASPLVVVVELAVCAGFVVLAMIGFKRSLWFVVVALAAHGVQDFFQPHLIPHNGAPVWWPDFCSAYDIAAAAFLALTLKRPRPDRAAA